MLLDNLPPWCEMWAQLVDCVYNMKLKVIWLWLNNKENKEFNPWEILEGLWWYVFDTWIEYKKN